MHKISVQLEAAFNRFGKIRKVRIAQRPQGFAFIEFEERCDAEGFILFCIKWLYSRQQFNIPILDSHISGLLMGESGTHFFFLT